jgi:hypothetical protein
VIAEGAVVSCGPVPMRPRCVRSFRGKSGGGKGEVDDNRRSALRVWHLAMVLRVGECTCGLMSPYNLLVNRLVLS